MSRSSPWGDGLAHRNENLIVRLITLERRLEILTPRVGVEGRPELTSASIGQATYDVLRQRHPIEPEHTPAQALWFAVLEHVDASHADGRWTWAVSSTNRTRRLEIVVEITDGLPNHFSIRLTSIAGGTPIRPVEFGPLPTDAYDEGGRTILALRLAFSSTTVALEYRSQQGVWVKQPFSVGEPDYSFDAADRPESDRIVFTVTFEPLATESDHWLRYYPPYLTLADSDPWELILPDRKTDPSAVDATARIL